MADFEHDASFKAAKAAEQLELDRYEAAYQEIYSEVLADGVITQDERDRLERAASGLGLDRGRLDALEDALRGAYESHHGLSVLDTSRMFAPRDTMAAPAPDFVPTVHPPMAPKIIEVETEVDSLRARVAFLEERVRELEQRLEEARAQVAYEVDFSDLDAPVPSTMLDEPESLHRRLKHDPRDRETLQLLFAAHEGDEDRQWCIAQALVYLGEDGEPFRSIAASHGGESLIHPLQALDGTVWRRYLYHPDDDVITSDILRVIVSAVLLAHSAALRQVGQIPTLVPERRLDPNTSTVQAARCFGWAAQALGMAPPQLYAAPELDALAQMVPTVPPACFLGKRALSGRAAHELAFIAGRELAYYRPERFIRMLVPDIIALQDLFLAALVIGNPKLPLAADVRQRVKPIASAIEPMLESAEMDSLRAGYAQFVEHGGFANLQRWCLAADLTAARTGLALAPDLATADRMLEVAGVPNKQQLMDDLIVFLTSDRHAKLREHMGVQLRS